MLFFFFGVFSSFVEYSCVPLCIQFAFYIQSTSNVTCWSERTTDDERDNAKCRYYIYYGMAWHFLRICVYVCALVLCMKAYCWSGFCCCCRCSARSVIVVGIRIIVMLSVDCRKCTIHTCAEWWCCIHSFRHRVLERALAASTHSAWLVHSGLEECRPRAARAAQQ